MKKTAPKKIALILVFLIIGCFSKGNTLKPNEIKPIVMSTLEKHVSYKKIDANLTAKMLDNYIYALDPAKMYFLKSDINDFKSQNDRLLKSFDTGNYSLISDIYNVYQKRFNSSMKIIREQIKANHDFSIDEKIIIDSDKIDYAGTEAELKERYRKYVKLQLLYYLTTDIKLDDAKNKLEKRYDRLEKNLEAYNETKILSIFCNAALMALDPHTNYLTQEEHEDFKMETGLKFEGIGARLRQEDGFVFVESIIPGSPSDKLPEELKLKPDDKIIAVAQNNAEPVSVVDMDLRDVVKLIRGEMGTTVKLTVMRDSGNAQKTEKLLIPIVRDKIILEDQAAKSELFIEKQNNKDVRIGYLKLSGFYYDYEDPKGKKCSVDVYNEVKKLKSQNMDCLVLDLRGNGGGYLEEALKIVGFFIDQGPILQIKYYNNQIQIKNDFDTGVIYNGPLIVLIDKFSASAAEIFAGTIKDYKRGLIIGSTPTFGKGSVQEYKEQSRLGTTDAVKVTMALFYQPSGTSNQLYGISPDVIVPDIRSIYNIGEDKLRYPLQWEPIPSANFTPYKNFLNYSLISTLQNKSKGRVNSTPEYIEFNKTIATLTEKLKNKETSLKLEKTETDKELKDLEKKIQDDKHDKLIDLKGDLFLREAFNVSSDYVQLLK